MKTIRDVLKDGKMYRVIDAELEKRHWGIKAKGQSPGKKPRYYIFDYRGLGLVTGIIRYHFFRENAPCRLYYRGQKHDWMIRPSLYRYCETLQDIQNANEWEESALNVIEKCFDPEGTRDEREALAQHYGLISRFLDVVDHIQTALWFACDEIEHESVRSMRDESIGYVEVIAVPDGAEVIDLRRKPSEWLRPHVQQGFCVRFPYFDTDLGRLADYLVVSFIIPRQSLILWSNYNIIPHEFFYPNRELDKGLFYWETAYQNLIDEGLIVDDKNGKKQFKPHIR